MNPELSPRFEELEKAIEDIDYAIFQWLAHQAYSGSLLPYLNEHNLVVGWTTNASLESNLLFLPS
jgi:hypothetical protein